MRSEFTMGRTAGILMPVSALPGKYGIGSFSEEAYKFVDFLEKAGQSYWQIIPLNPPNHEQSFDTPYQSFSAFAGNPYFVSLDKLKAEGLLTAEEIEEADFGDEPQHIDYDKLYANRLNLLRKAYDRADKVNDEGFNNFVRDNGWWLDDYAMFMSLKTFFGGVEWRKWPEDIRRRWGFAMDYYHDKLYFDIEFHKYIQYRFFNEWYALKAYANSKHIGIIGDIAIYVSLDSADAWAHPELFQLDENLEQTAVAGCPPDQFSADGQIWGTPLYRWDEHRKTDYGWWMARLWHNFCTCDMLRIDHFRGLDEYFSIPFGSKTALAGHWEPGPGMSLFWKMWENMGHKAVLVEDLGTQTDSVRQMVRDSGFPNMKVLQFGFDTNDYGAGNDYIPHNVPEHCIMYTGTHDNDPIHGWFMKLSQAEKDMIKSYYGTESVKDEDMWKVLVNSALMSRAETCIIPIQDYMGLGSEARWNEPSHLENNYFWRVADGDLSDELAQRIRTMTRTHGRLNWETEK
ncbi:MAG: 4-alpha-glucanotransferase [Clostridia bacterium]|nr:4-alpha-glucanotransferase [Clostridia bacterium]